MQNPQPTFSRHIFPFGVQNVQTCDWEDIQVLIEPWLSPILVCDVMVFNNLIKI